MEPENSRLLVVDDDVGVLDTYRTMLGIRKGIRATTFRIDEEEEEDSPIPLFEIVFANSGEEAVELVSDALIEARPFCGGFFDITMPGGIDGIETIKQIRQLDPNMLCTIVTAYQDRTLEEISALFPSDKKDEWNYMNKPFNRMEISQRALNMVYTWNLKRESEMHKQDLEHINLQLEQMVKERTKRLDDTIEKLRETNEKLMQLDKMKSEFINVVSHELRTPLSILECDVAMLNSGQFGDVTDKQTKSLTRLSKATDRMASVVNRMIEIIEDGPVERTDVNLLPIVQRVIVRLEQLRAMKEIEISVEIPEDMMAHSHQLKLGESITPILDNALRYGKQGGRVIIRASILNDTSKQEHIHRMWELARNRPMEMNQDAMAPHDGEWILLEVIDDGKGLEKKLLEEVFQPFYIEDCSNIREDGHIGLGLPMARHVMRRLGGAVDASSDGEGLGATFCLYIPKR